MKRAAALLAIAILAMAPAHATTVFVAALGEVTENLIADSPLGDVAAGEGVVMSFTVDSNDFVDGAGGDSRGYVISSFSLAFSGGVTVGLLIGGDTAYFALADGIPVSDGFWVSSSPDSPGGAQLEQEPYNVNLDLGYDGDTLSSLDILDAGGVYDFDGLTRFGFSVWQVSPDFPAMSIDYHQLRIQALPPVPVPATLWLLASSLLGLIGIRRR
jgi:hypothetical protein